MDTDNDILYTAFGPSIDNNCYLVSYTKDDNNNVTRTQVQLQNSVNNILIVQVVDIFYVSQAKAVYYFGIKNQTTLVMGTIDISNGNLTQVCKILSIFK